MPGPPWLRVLLRTRLAPFGLLILFGIVILAATADFLTPYDPNEQHYSYVLKPPGADFPLGTTQVRSGCAPERARARAPSGSVES